MTATDPADLAGQLTTTVADHDTAVARAEQAALDAQAAADQAAEEARAAANARARALQRVPPGMRAIGDQLDQLDDECKAEALAGDPSAAWLKWRVESAKLAGQWRALGHHTQAATGRRPPVGPTTRLRPLPGHGPLPNVTGSAEGFGDWLHALTSTAEHAAEQRSFDETTEQLRAARDAGS